MCIYLIGWPYPQINDKITYHFKNVDLKIKFARPIKALFHMSTNDREPCWHHMIVYNLNLDRNMNKYRCAKLQSELVLASVSAGAMLELYLGHTSGLNILCWSCDWPIKIDEIKVIFYKTPVWYLPKQLLNTDICTLAKVYITCY